MVSGGAPTSRRRLSAANVDRLMRPADVYFARERWLSGYGSGEAPAGLLVAIIARDSAQVLRLSVTYALVDGADRIGADHVRAAWALWRYRRASAAFVFGESVGHPLADALLRAVRDAGPAGLDGRAQYLVLGGNATKGQLEAARELLVAKGLVAIETVATGGRPSTVLKATECEQS